MANSWRGRGNAWREGWCKGKREQERRGDDSGEGCGGKRGRERRLVCWEEWTREQRVREGRVERGLVGRGD